MSLLLQIYIVIVSAYLLWSVFGFLFENEVLDLGELPLFLLYPCVILGIGKYTIEGFAQQLGALSFVVTVILSIGVVFLAIISIMSLLTHGSDSNGYVTSEDSEQDLDGGKITVEEEMELAGEKIAQVFRENTSPLEKMAALGELAEAQEEDDLTLKDKLFVAVGAMLYIPALFLNYMA